MAETTVRLSPGWYNLTFAEGANPDMSLPAIYEWHVATGDGSSETYIGKASTIRRRISNYRRNIEALCCGRPYHIQGRDFRAVHRLLHQAYVAGWPITLTILENPARENLSIRETAAIITRRPTLNRTHSL